MIIQTEQFKGASLSRDQAVRRCYIPKLMGRAWAPFLSAEVGSLSGTEHPSLSLSLSLHASFSLAERIGYAHRNKVDRRDERRGRTDVDGGAFFPLGPQNAPQCGLVIM